ncbi:MAG: AMP-binding protein [Polyangiaceae bacterium]|jgi:long-chain acyl-CoA synthetase
MTATAAANVAQFKAYESIRSVADIVNGQLSTYGNRTAIRFDNGTLYDEVSFVDYHAHLVQMIRYLQDQRATQRVVVTLCKNRIEWDMVAMAAFYTANILFPLDTKFNEVELDHLLALSRPDYALVPYSQLERFRAIAKKLDLRTTIFVPDLMESYEDAGVERLALQANEIGIKEITAPYRRLDGSPAGVKESPLLENPDTILGHYATSGTVSLPKIVRISHGNIVAEVNCAYDVINLRPNETLLNIGPYTHIATLVEFLVSKSRGFSVTYFTREPDDDDVLEDEVAKLHRQGVRIKALLGVPKFWVYLVKEVLEEMKNKPSLKKLYETLAAIERNSTLQDIGTLDKAKLTAARILLRNKLGGHFAYGISSSTKMDGALVRVLGKLGITCIDIYGATECTGIISRNKLSEIVPGSCGKLIPELEYRLDSPRKVPKIEREVGILLVKGQTVAKQYIEKDRGVVSTPMTADGYYVTGDLCWVDDDRQVYIVGRQKELMEWDDGTLIDPQYVSNLLVRSVFVKDAMVARRRPEDEFLSVFVFPDYKRLEKDPEYKKEITTGVTPRAALKRRCVEAIQFAESIAGITPELNKEHIYILPRKLERTPTHKIKFIFELQRIDGAERI